jgi:hypothetical protein
MIFQHMQTMACHLQAWTRKHKYGEDLLLLLLLLLLGQIRRRLPSIPARPVQPVWVHYAGSLCPR